MKVHLIARYICKDYKPILIGLFFLHKIENKFYWHWIKGNEFGIFNIDIVTKNHEKYNSGLYTR